MAISSSPLKFLPCPLPGKLHVAMTRWLELGGGPGWSSLQGAVGRDGGRGPGEVASGLQVGWLQQLETKAVVFFCGCIPKPALSCRTFLNLSFLIGKIKHAAWGVWWTFTRGRSQEDVHRNTVNREALCKCH